MVKGNICEKCRKNEAIIDYDIQGWRKWSVCDECYKELQLCSKCKKNKATNLIEENKEKKQVCADCCQKGDNGNENLCEKCLKKDIDYKITGTDIKGSPIVELNLCSECKQTEISKWGHGESCCGEKGNSTKQGVKISSDGSISWKCSVCPFERKSISTKKATANCDKCNKVVELENPGYPKELHHVTNQRTKQEWMVCDNCYKCSQCKQKNIETIANEQSDKWEAGTWLCHDCHNNKPGNKKSKDKKHNEYACEKCHTSCWKDKGDKGSTYYRKRITHWYTDFRKTINYFCIDGDYGNSVKKGNSKCAEEFKKEHFQTCPNCNKTEWPDMDKGWMLDYEIHKAFCSSKCHVEFRQMSWEQAQNLTQIVMYPPQLDISSGDNKDFDWEKEGLKREVLFWREYARELEQRLSNQDNLTPQERQQADYLRNLQQNTLRNAEQAYQSRYGSLSEDGSEKGKGMSGGVIFLIIIGVVALVWGIIFLLNRNKSQKEKRNWH